MKRIRYLLSLLLLPHCLLAQKKTFQFSAGPELLRSFSHKETFWGAGASLQAEAWVKPALGLGLNVGYYHFSGTGTASARSYGALPLFAVIRYPLPLTPGLYGQDVMGYTFIDGASYEVSGAKVRGGFTYYFALGYVIRDHIDISVKIGRPRLDKKADPANINEHNFGLKVAYRF